MAELILHCDRCDREFESDTEGRIGVYIDRPGEGHILERQEVLQLCGRCRIEFADWRAMGRKLGK